MDGVETRLVNLPHRIRGLMSVDENGEPMIYLNARLTIQQHKEAYEHELNHIRNDDLTNTKSIEEVEQLVNPPEEDSKPLLSGFQQRIMV